MKRKRNQEGMTLLSFVVVLAVVGFALYVGMKLFPMYEEYYSIRMVLKGIASETSTGASMEPEKVRELFAKRLDVNYSDNVKPSDLKFDRVDGGWRMSVAYEVRRPLIANLDVVGKFEAHQDLKAGAGE